ncbi:MAG: hypothetical protein KUG71_00295 [Porticoccaceae bacterium]|nr:hypothetical protein [Porticoccaceae bacterium]
MKIGFVVNDLQTEYAGYTSTLLAQAACRLGHEVWYMGVGDFSLRPDDHTFALARSLAPGEYQSGQALLDRLRDEQTPATRVCVDDLDFLLLRNDANADALGRPWARMAGINFGFLAQRHGVEVLNDPGTLAHSLTKLYLQYFPESIRPKTLITHDYDESLEFIASMDGYGVIKPLFGSGGRNVFLIRPSDRPNVHQMMDVIFREEGYMIVQEYLPKAVEGDTRLFMVDGELLEIDGKIAAIHRIPDTKIGDMRSNMTAGGTSHKAEITQQARRIAEVVGPKLKEDGIFIAGLDIVGDKVMEINILSPGGMLSAERLEGVSFSEKIIRLLEQKI